MQKIISDNDLGLIVMRKYQRSKCYVIRLKRQEIWVSLPLSGSYRKALEFVKANKEALLRKQQEHASLRPPDYDEETLRKQALSYLPARLQELAAEHHFTYDRVRISKSRSRWGSCSSKKTINLSLFVMTLPPHLIDYILLHELCHTKEMNHGRAFWQLMDEVTGGKTNELRIELRAKRTIG